MGIDVKSHKLNFNQVTKPWEDIAAIRQRFSEQWDDFGQDGVEWRNSELGEPDPGEGNGVWDAGESFDDFNGNGKWDDYVEPMEVAGYFQNTFEVPWMIINAGLRIDAVNYNSKIWSDPDGNFSATKPWFWEDCGQDGLCSGHNSPLSDIDGDFIHDLDIGEGNRKWDKAEPFEDRNNNGSWNDFQNASLHFVVEVVDDTTGGGDYFIEGIVRDFDGNPISDAYVNSYSEDGGEWSAQANEEGYYHIDIDTSNGMVIVFVGDDGDDYWYDLTMVDVSEGGNQFDFSLGLREETTLLGVAAITSNWDPVSFAEIFSPQSPQGMSVSDWTGWDYVTVYPSDNFAEIFGYSEEYGEAYAQLEGIVDIFKTIISLTNTYQGKI